MAEPNAILGDAFVIAEMPLDSLRIYNDAIGQPIGHSQPAPRRAGHQRAIGALARKHDRAAIPARHGNAELGEGHVKSVGENDFLRFQVSAQFSGSGDRRKGAEG